MDYSKHRFEQQKKEKENRKKQKTVELKEIRLSQNIDIHDINVKIKNCIKFLKSGAKVKITIRFRGREMSHTDGAYKILKKFAEDVEEYGTVEKQPKLEAKTLAMFLAPKPESAVKKADKKEQAEQTEESTKETTNEAKENTENNSEN